MKHKPRGFLSDAERAMDFIRANPVLGVGNHPHRGEPLVQTDRAVLKNRSDFDRKLFATMLAFPDAPRFQVVGFKRPAMHANYTVRETQFRDVLGCNIGVREIKNRVLKRLGQFRFVFHAPILAQTSLCVKYIIAKRIVRRRRRAH